MPRLKEKTMHPQRRKPNGFSLIELLVVVAIILIISAIAIPSLMKSRIAANEAAAVSACRKIVTAEVVYFSTFGAGYTQTLAQLGPDPGNLNGPPTAAFAGLLDELLSAGAKHGYQFTYVSQDADGDGMPEAFRINANPASPGFTGERRFFTDQSGVIRFNFLGPAGVADPPIG